MFGLLVAAKAAIAWAITMVAGVSLLLIGTFTYTGAIPMVPGVLACIVCAGIAHVAGDVYHEDWLRTAPADVVREERYVPLDDHDRPRR